MNLPSAQTVALTLAALGGGGFAAFLGQTVVAWISRKPPAIVNAEVGKMEAESAEAQASVRLRATEEWERLIGHLRSEIDRQDDHLARQAVEIAKQAVEIARQAEENAAQRKEGHRLRNFATAVQTCGVALMKHVDLLEDIIRALGDNPPARPVVTMPRIDEPATP